MILPNVSRNAMKNVIQPGLVLVVVHVVLIHSLVNKAYIFVGQSAS